MRIAAWRRLGPAQGTVVPWAFWLAPHLTVGLVGKGGRYKQNTNHGHIPDSACRRRRVRRIQPERYVQVWLGGME